MINEILQCDFCSMPGPVWRYPALSFIAYCAPNVAGESVGDWAACDLCHLRIEANDRSGLAQRSLDELILKHPEAIAAAAVLYKDLAELHQRFFAQPNRLHGDHCGRLDAARAETGIPRRSHTASAGRRELSFGLRCTLHFSLEVKGSCRVMPRPLINL